MHRAAAINDSAQAAMIGAGKARMVDEPAHHGRRGEEADIAVRRQERCDLVRIEAARFRHDVLRAHGDEGQRVKSGAVRQRRRMNFGVAGADRLDVGQDKPASSPSRLRCVSIAPLGRPVVPLV